MQASRLSLKKRAPWTFLLNCQTKLKSKWRPTTLSFKKALRLFNQGKNYRLRALWRLTSKTQTNLITSLTKWTFTVASENHTKVCFLSKESRELSRKCIRQDFKRIWDSYTWTQLKESSSPTKARTSSHIHQVISSNWVKSKNVASYWKNHSLNGFSKKDNSILLSGLIPKRVISAMITLIW